MSEKSKYQQELESLPEWCQKMVTALSSCISYGGGDAGDTLAGLAPGKRDKYEQFNIILSRGAVRQWFDGFIEMKDLANALTAPWPKPSAPPRERRSLNLVEVMVDSLKAEDGGGFDQPCCFGNRVEYHAVYCHNEAWPNAPRKCRRGDWGANAYDVDREENKHENCPGFVANPDFKS